MKDGLTPGITRERSYTVTDRMGVGHLGDGVPSVLSTPSMIGLMERTCMELVTPWMEENEQTVGIHVDVRHLAPTRIGQEVTIKATLQEFEGKRFRFAIEAVNDQGVKIGTGFHRRSLINTKKFTNSR